MPSLIPSLEGRQLTVDVALNTPTILRNRIAKLTDKQILLDKLFHGYGAQVEGGGILYNVVQASDFYMSTDVEQRNPGAEYRVVEGTDPDPKLAFVADWGGKFQVFEEQRTRNNVSYMDQQTTQLANTLSRKLDVEAIRVVEDALVEDAANVVAGHTWNGLVFVGPLDDITPSASRPTADLSAGQLASDLQELSVKHDLLIVHPNQAHALRVAYGDNLDDMLKSAGVGLFSNPRMAPGNAYCCEKGQVGTIGFEVPLTVDVWEDKGTRSWWVQGYVVPAMAVDRPFALKKLTGLDAAAA